MPPKKEIPTDLPLSVRVALLLHPHRNSTGYIPFENAADFDFEPGAKAWSRQNAWWLADASWIAYLHDADEVARAFVDRASMTSCELIASRGTTCYVAQSRDFAIVTFRGTQTDDWNDLFDIVRLKTRPWDIGRVHGGFADALENVREPLERALKALPSTCRVWFTGHSLGGALATLSAYRYRDRCAGAYTFASPRVGNGAFAAQFDAAIAGRSIRYVNDHDAVPHVPQELLALPHGLYTHVEQLRWIAPDGQVETTHTPSHFVQEIFGDSRVLLDLINLLRTGSSIQLPDTLSDHTPLFYALHCWNDLAVHSPVQLSDSSPT